MARNSLLLAAAFSAFAGVFAVFAFGRGPLLALLPATLVALLPALAARAGAPYRSLGEASIGPLYALN